MKVIESPNIAAPELEMATLLAALTQLRRGDASARLPLHWEGLPGKVADVFNDLAERNARLLGRVHRFDQRADR